jgi:hypothetical protein
LCIENQFGETVEKFVGDEPVPHVEIAGDDLLDLDAHRAPARSNALELEAAIGISIGPRPEAVALTFAIVGLSFGCVAGARTGEIDRRVDHIVDRGAIVGHARTTGEKQTSNDRQVTHPPPPG